MKQYLEKLALKFLESRGYYIRCLWHINDVKRLYNCDKEIAMEILDRALTNDNIMVDTELEIMNAAEEINLTLKCID